jgi:branched-chain amino acid transport system permease protein
VPARADEELPGEQLFTGFTVGDNLVIAALAERRGLFALDLLRRIDRVPGLDVQVESTVAMVGLRARADVSVAELPYGEKRRLEIGLALAASPSLLLLDEPLAGMSRASARRRAAVEEYSPRARARGGRTRHGALFELAERITVLHEGALLAEGMPAEIQRNRLVQEAYLGGVAAA